MRDAARLALDSELHDRAEEMLYREIMPSLMAEDWPFGIGADLVCARCKAQRAPSSTRRRNRSKAPRSAPISDSIIGTRNTA